MGTRNWSSGRSSCTRRIICSGAHSNFPWLFAERREEYNHRANDDLGTCTRLLLIFRRPDATKPTGPRVPQRTASPEPSAQRKSTLKRVHFESVPRPYTGPSETPTLSVSREWLYRVGHHHGASRTAYIAQNRYIHPHPVAFQTRRPVCREVRWVPFFADAKQRSIKQPPTY
jgi:hypothetical protein